MIMNLFNSYLLWKNKALSRFEFRKGELVLKSKPVWIQIEPTTLCNIHCAMCRTEEENREWGKLAEKDLFRCLYESGWLKYVSLLEIGGWGETFLHPQIEWFLEECSKYRNLKIRITTNGLLLTNDKILTAICKMPKITLIFSIDSADPFIYEKIRRGGSWKTLLNNINLLNKKKKEMNSGLIKNCDCLVNKMNVNDLNKMVDFALEYGFDVLSFIRVSNCEGLEVSDGLAIEAMEKAKEYAKKKKIKVYTYGKYRKKEEISRAYDDGMTWRCERPWKHMLIQMNGDVVPCCYLENYKCGATMGNILKDQFSKIWNSEKYISLRRSAFRGYPDFCDVETGGCKAKTKFTPNIKLKGIAKCREC